MNGDVRLKTYENGSTWLSVKEGIKVSLVTHDIDFSEQNISNSFNTTVL